MGEEPWAEGTSVMAPRQEPHGFVGAGGACLQATTLTLHCITLHL